MIVIAELWSKKMIASATNRADGAVTNFEDGTNRIVLDGPADVRLGIPKADIVSTVQVGNDLVVTLVNGEQLVIENFFVADAAGAISQLIAEGGAVAFEGAGSGLVAAGLGALTLGVVASSTGGSDAPAPTAAEIALEKINAYDGTDATVAPTLEDYAAAGVEGVTADNLEALNALAAASADEDLTAEELAALVGEANTQVALDLINAYDGTDATVAPTLEDYATAGVEGVTADTLEALNAAVAASDDDELTADEVEALLADVELAAALEVLNDYSGAGSVAPNAEDYAALGFDTLTPEQVAAVNALLPTTADLTTLEEVQALIDGVTEGALATIIADATDGDGATDSAAETFGEAGVTGVTAENVDAINTYIAGLPEGAIDTTEELQAIVDAVNAAAEEAAAEALAEINAWDGTESLAEVGELLAAVGIDSTIVTQDLLAAEGLEVAAAEAILAAVAAAEGDLTVEELQALIDETIAELLIDNMPMSTAENTAIALEAVGVTGVTEANQDEVLDAIAAAVNADPNLADSPEDLQAIVDTVVAGLADDAMDLINAYAVDQANPEPNLDDYVNIGVALPEGFTDLSPSEAAVIASYINKAISETEGNLTTEEIQAFVDQIAAEASDAESVILAYSADQSEPAPTLADYEAFGVNDFGSNSIGTEGWENGPAVNDDNLQYINNLVAALAPEQITPRLLMSVATHLLKTVDPTQATVDFEIETSAAGDLQVSYSVDRTGDGVADQTATLTIVDDLVVLKENFTGEGTPATGFGGYTYPIEAFTYDEFEMVDVHTVYNADGTFARTETPSYDETGKITAVLLEGTTWSRTDVWEYYDDGTLKSRTFMTDPDGDGVYDNVTARVHYDESGVYQSVDIISVAGGVETVTHQNAITYGDDGRIAAISSDTNFDGNFDSVTTYVYADNGVKFTALDNNTQTDSYWDTVSFDVGGSSSHELSADEAALAIELASIWLSGPNGATELTISDDVLSILGGGTADDTGYRLTINGDVTDTVVLNGGIALQADSNAGDTYAEYVGTQGGLILISEAITDVQVVV